MADPLDMKALIERCLVGEATASEHQALAAWLRESEANREEYLAELDFYRTVRGALVGELRTAASSAANDDSASFLSLMHDLEPHEPVEAVDLTDELSRRLQKQRAKQLALASAQSVDQEQYRPLIIPKVVFWGGIAAMLLLAAGLWTMLQPNPPAPTGVTQVQPEIPSTPTPAPTPQPQPQLIQPNIQPVATLTALHGAQWGATTPQLGDELRPGQVLMLTVGFAEITTVRGAKVILQAPCKVELIDSPNAMRLHTGKLVGVCQTPDSRGFTVLTPTARVVDIGTRFGINQSDSARIQVIEGEVVVKANNQADDSPSTSLVAGQSAEIDQRADRVTLLDRLDDRFVASWSAISNPPRITGRAGFEPAMPTALGINGVRRDWIQVYPERTGIRLTKALEVTLAQPGSYTMSEQLKDTLPADTVVDSYFINLIPEDASGLTRQYSATIHFDHPILGVVATSTHLANSHATLGRAGTAYGSMDTHPDGIDPSGLEKSKQDPSFSDNVQISEDRRTLTLNLATGIALDQCRVLVQSQDPAP